jgi:hypothetical protein
MSENFRRTASPKTRVPSSRDWFASSRKSDYAYKRTDDGQEHDAVYAVKDGTLRAGCYSHEHDTDRDFDKASGDCVIYTCKEIPLPQFIRLERVREARVFCNQPFLPASHLLVLSVKHEPLHHSQQTRMWRPIRRFEPPVDDQFTVKKVASLRHT